MSVEELLPRFLPTSYTAPVLPPYFVQQIIVNWLKIEITSNPERELPTLARLAGWRNLEVYTYVQDTKGEWQHRLVQDMYH